MLLLDANILVYAAMRQMPQHAAHRSWLVSVIGGAAQFAVPDLVATAFIRVTTNSRIFQNPLTIAEAFDFLNKIRAAPAFVQLSPGASHWSIFENLCLQVTTKSNDIPDAYLAALAIERQAELQSADKGFSRYPGLQWKSPV